MLPQIESAVIYCAKYRVPAAPEPAPDMKITTTSSKSHTIFDELKSIL
jgi:hypothetical protein